MHEIELESYELMYYCSVDDISMAWMLQYIFSFAFPVHQQVRHERFARLRRCLDVRRASGFGGCCSGLVDILLCCVSPPLNPEQKHVDLCCAAVRSDKSRIGMRAVCRVTLDTPSPSLESECERVTAEKGTFNAKQNRVCLKVHVYMFIWKSRASFLFFSLTLCLFIVDLLKLGVIFFFLFFFTENTCMWATEAVCQSALDWCQIFIYW